MFVAAEHFSLQDDQSNHQQQRSKCPVHGGQTQYHTNTQSKSQPQHPSNITILSIIDDLWIEIIYFSTMKDFIHLKEACIHLNTMMSSITTKHSNYRSNKLWEYKSKQLCCSIPFNYDPKNNFNWYIFYCQLYKIITFGDYYNANIYNNYKQFYSQNIKNSFYHTDGEIMLSQWLDRNINPSLYDDPDFDFNTDLINIPASINPYKMDNTSSAVVSRLSRNAYFVSITTNEAIRELNPLGDDTAYLIKLKQAMIKQIGIRDFHSKSESIEDVLFSKYGCKSIKFPTDDYGFDLQLIDLICKYDAHLVLNMLLSNPIYYYGINYTFTKQVPGLYYKASGDYGDYGARDYGCGSNATNIIKFGVYQLLFHYSAKYGSDNVFNYMFNRYKDELKLIYIKYYNSPKSYLYLNNKGMYWFYHLFIAAMKGGNDIIINKVLQCMKLNETYSDCVNFTTFEMHQTGTGTGVSGRQNMKITFESILNNINSNMYNRYINCNNTDSNNCSSSFNSNYSIIYLFTGYKYWDKLAINKRIKTTTIDKVLTYLGNEKKTTLKFNENNQSNSLLHYLIDCHSECGKRLNININKSEFYKDILNTIISHECIDINITNTSKQTPLMYAIANKLDIDIIKLFLHASKSKSESKSKFKSKSNSNFNSNENSKLNLFCKDVNGQNLFHYAILTAKCNPNEIINDEYTLNLLQLIYNYVDKSIHELESIARKSVSKLFNQQESNHGDTPYIQLCRICSSMDDKIRKKTFEYLINVCKVDVSIGNFQNLRGSDFIQCNNYNEFKNWLVAQEKQNQM